MHRREVPGHNTQKYTFSLEAPKKKDRPRGVLYEVLEQHTGVPNPTANDLKMKELKARKVEAFWVTKLIKDRSLAFQFIFIFKIFNFVVL